MKRRPAQLLPAPGEHAKLVAAVREGSLLAGNGHPPQNDLPTTRGSRNMSVSIADLQAFADAWNRHDVDALMRFMTDDCVFESSAGPDACGSRFAGTEAVRAGFSEVWKTYPDAQWRSPRHFVCGDRGVSEWTFTGTRVDGSRVEVNGCDVFTFRDGRIAIKNSYRKNRPPTPA